MIGGTKHRSAEAGGLPSVGSFEILYANLYISVLLASFVYFY